MLRASKTLAPLAVGIAALLAAPYAAAQPAGALPPAQSVAGVKYVQGGFGKDESAAMLKAASQYPLSLVFSGGKANNYVGDVDIRVRDAAGKTVLQTNAEGPIVLIDLPAGKYVIDAEYRDKTLTQRIDLTPKRAARLDFHWQEAD
jgi:hypothetical protein